MPLLRFDLVEGRTDVELRTLLDVTHAVVIASFGVPPRDRYQIVHEHKASRMIIEDTGLAIPRTDKIVMPQVTSRPRDREAKQAFYAALVAALEARCAITPDDVVVNFVINDDEGLVVWPGPSAVPYRRSLTIGSSPERRPR